MRSPLSDPKILMTAAGREKRMQNVCILLELREHDCTSSALDKLRSDSRANKPFHDHFAMGIKKYVEGDFEGAAAKLRFYLKYWPQDSGALKIFGLSSFEMAKQSKKEAGEKRMAESGKETEQSIEETKALLVDAENAFGKRTRLFPDCADAWSDLGFLFLETERPEEAFRCFEEALRLRKDFVPAKVGAVLYFLCMSQPKAAKEWLDTIPDEAFEDPGLLRLMQETLVAFAEYEEAEKEAEEFRRKKATGLEFYHGRWMKSEDKAKLLRMEITQVERLLDTVVKMNETATAEDIALWAYQGNQLLSKFQPEEVMDKIMAEKALILLGFLHQASDRALAEMKLTLDDHPGEGEGLLAFLQAYERSGAFSSEVHIPLMRLFGKHINDYVSRYGTEAFEKLMKDNGLPVIPEKLK